MLERENLTAASTVSWGLGPNFACRQSKGPGITLVTSFSLLDEGMVRKELQCF